MQADATLRRSPGQKLCSHQGLGTRVGREGIAVHDSCPRGAQVWDQRAQAQLVKVEPFVPRRPFSNTAPGADVARAEVAEMERIKVR